MANILNKVDTVSLKGNDYALVPARLKEFREQNPNADIESEPHWHDDGSLDFKTRITKDLKDPNSAKGTGWAHYSAKEMQSAKAFEKLQTVSKGRALADIGYLNNGQIATTEEMDEFNAYKDQQIENAVDHLKSAPTIDDLKDIFMNLGSLMAHSKVVDAKNARKEELQNG